ncbi:fast leu-rich domain-containing [Holotrichia oblita]|uniref:Fast leu-rich domain-containing n=1 Tax=Holotrichia oblita TaxID=644536 RepID=A0ACB9T6R4_HOLOL|nr:fast leu-rich domain-containing [Holotrichia oblita]
MKLTKSIGSTIMKAYSNLTRSYIHRTYYFHYPTKCILPNTGLKLALQNPSINNDDKKYISHSDENTDDESELTNDINDEYTQLYMQPQSIKDILYPNSKDVLIKKINECASLQDIYAFLMKHGDELNTMHITQLVLVLWDLQKMFYHVTLSSSPSYVNVLEFDKISANYMKTFKDDQISNRLWKLIESKISDFSIEQLSYVILYLNKMGIHPKEEIITILTSQFQKQFNADSSLSSLTRFMSAIYLKGDLSYFYNIQQFIPIVLDSIDRCETVEDLYVTTSCLTNMNALITKETLSRYVKKVTDFFKRDKIGSDHYKLVINIMMLLNISQWRDQNAGLIIQCLSLLQNNMHLLNVNELLIVHEVFCKIQEPGHILNEIQRNASKYLLQLEEEMNPQLDIRLKLFSCITYFAPPSQRPHFKKILQKYIDYLLDGKSLLELHKILLFTKICDADLCEKYWKKLLLCLDNKSFLDACLFKICQNYINFNEDLPDRRCPDFENKIVGILEHDINNKLLGLIPAYFPTVASFLLIFGRNRNTLETIIRKIDEFALYFSPLDCLHLSHGLQQAADINKLLTNVDITNMRGSLDKCTYKLLLNDCDTTTINVLTKSYIRRSSVDNVLFERLLDSYRNVSSLYSMLFKNISYNLFVTNTLLPDMLNKVVDYINLKKDDILGFNIERILHLCYHVGFLPDKYEEFFQTAIDVILRDQERMSGLSYLQASLSLCFYHRLPQSFIKQTFNVEFLEKLDVELANCYFKDVYPLRVRHYMMQLNRAVCLDYPESNVPWFHQKYLEQRHDNIQKRNPKDTVLHNSLRECLIRLGKSATCLEENEVSPYGYHIDFTLHLDGNDELITPNRPAKKIAVLIMRKNFYSKIHKRLKGFYQLKIRHLEILGYKTIIMDFGELLHTAKRNEHAKPQIQYYSTKFSPPKKEQRSRNLSVNVQKFLARKEAEEKVKQREALDRRNKLLALRSQDKKATRRVNVMLKRTKSANQSVIEDALDADNTAVTLAGPSQPDEDDYGYVSQESSALYNKMMEKYSKMPDEPKFPEMKKKISTNLSSTKDRVKAALEREKEEALLPHRRKRKHTSDTDGDSGRNFDGIIDPDIEPEKKESSKPKFKAAPLVNFSDLLKLAEKKQFEPVVIEPKKDDEERPLTKKQKKEIEREKEWRERKDSRGKAPQEKPPIMNRIPKVNDPGPQSTDRIPKKVNPDNQDSKRILNQNTKMLDKNSNISKVNKLPNRPDINDRKYPDANKNCDMNRKTLNGVKNSASYASKTESRESHLMPPPPIPKPRPSIPSEKLKSSIPPKDLQRKAPIPDNRIGQKNSIPPNGIKNKSVPNPSKQLPPNDLKPKQNPSNALKPKQFPPNDVRPKQFPPSDVRPKQFPPNDLRPKQFPPQDVRRNIKDVKRKPLLNKRRILDDDEEDYDPDMDDFIDDGPEGEEDYSKYISEIFGYDKRRYRFDDDDVDNMESSFSQQMKEEVISTKIGMYFIVFNILTIITIKIFLAAVTL